VERKARIVHLIDRNVDTAYFRAIARHHDAARYPVSIGSLAAAGPLQAAMRELGVGTFAHGAARRAQYPAAVRRLAAQIARPPVIVHAHCFDPTLVGLAAAWWRGAPFVFTRHHSDHHIRLGKAWHTRLDAHSARHAARVIAVSQATRRILTEVEGVPAARVAVVRNGMEKMRLPDTAAAAALRRSVPAGTRIVLHVARLHEEKGHAVLFAALPAVRAAAGPLVVWLAGSGAERAALQAHLEVLGLQHVVSFLGERQDIPELLAAADAVVLPSLAESFGFAAIEALSAARPLVVSDAGGLPEVVGEAALVVPRGDSGALAAALLSILSDEALAARLRAAGPARAALFDAAEMVRGYEKVYDELD
jgi:glycosyltransferase involved in cell wall biosynthesis